MSALRVRLCDCGARPKPHCIQVAEDAEETWIECHSCGAASERVEYPYCDYDTAAMLWNDRKMEQPDS